MMKKLLIISYLLLVFSFISLTAPSIGVAGIAPLPPDGGSPAPVSCTGKAIQTAIGCIDVETPTAFVNNIIKLAIGVAGGFAILLIIYGGFLYLTSAGNPEKVQAGKELITSAIVGLLVIIFAVFIMEMIGVQILKIF